MIQEPARGVTRMDNKLLTVLIRTIGRPTLINSINSAKTELGNVIVVADDVDIDLKSLPKKVTYLRTGRKFDKYGSAAINMGAYACNTPYFCLLDDDDEFIPGAGEFMLKAIQDDPSIDIWIPGLIFNNGGMLCLNSGRGVVVGNIAVPTYKTELLFKLPFSQSIVKDDNFTDFHHVYSLFKSGSTIGWYGTPLYKIRPKLDGTNGRGKL